MIISDPAVTRDDRKKEALRAVATPEIPPKPKPAEGVRGLLTPKQRQALEIYKGESLTILETDPPRPIISAEEASAAAELRAQIQVCLKGLDMLRRKVVDPLNVKVKIINNEMKRWAEPLKERYGRAEAVLLAWQQKERARVQREQQDAIRRQEEAAVREAEATAKAQAAETPEARHEAMQEAEVASTELMVAQVETPRDPVKGWKGDEGTSSVTERWTFEVVKPELVPRDYCVPDSKLIRAAVHEGVRELAGVHIYQKEGLATRARMER
jgi:hypothetical protein